MQALPVPIPDGFDIRSLILVLGRSTHTSSSFDRLLARVLGRSLVMGLDELKSKWPTFALRCTSMYQLKHLRDLDAEQLSGLRSLSISLSSGQFFDEETRKGLKKHKLEISALLDIAKAKEDMRDIILKELEATVPHLHACVPPGVLHLTLACPSWTNISYCGRWIKLILPGPNRMLELFDGLPSGCLRGCALQLHQEPTEGGDQIDAIDPGFRAKMAKTVSRLLQGANLKTPTTFPCWGRLPTEIQLRVLEFTHLGADGDYVSDRAWFIVDGMPEDKCCNMCTGQRRRWHDETWGDSECFCHSENTTRERLRSWWYDAAVFSSTCRCRVVPVEIFRVSRHMHQLAQQVFFSSSSFDFGASNPDPLRTGRLWQCHYRKPPANVLGNLDGFAGRPSIKRMNNRENTVNFLSKQLPSSGLRWIRDLRLGFVPEEDPNFGDRFDPRLRGQWDTLADLIKRHCNLANLRITFDMYEITTGSYECRGGDSDEVLRMLDDACDLISSRYVPLLRQE
ncbi:hypothetical protein B0T19DRAFT_476334 [Cercophora scortea]|uniref:Uncharacterized protein n=1 Tax=Cercophora scortea TaxID=314031 RepID=A0AAE0IDM1_9PEZI|nr:hypothetical protein B0T19DRAFT_476334 [Cercophora scortea]